MHTQDALSRLGAVLVEGRDHDDIFRDYEVARDAIKAELPANEHHMVDVLFRRFSNPFCPRFRARFCPAPREYEEQGECIRHVGTRLW